MHMATREQIIGRSKGSGPIGPSREPHHRALPINTYRTCRPRDARICFLCLAFPDFLLAVRRDGQLGLVTAADIVRIGTNSKSLAQQRLDRIEDAFSIGYLGENDVLSVAETRLDRIQESAAAIGAVNLSVSKEI